jgi:pyruvate/2-oxoglutarate dehydrogenase complex dihydrolipoamide acyltransferase (E2) component
MEVAAPASDTLGGIRAKLGDQVPVKVIIAYILAEDETEADIHEDKATPLQDTDRVVESLAVGRLRRLGGQPGNWTWN